MKPEYRRSKADQVYDLVRSRIVSMQLAPGARFVEREISEETGFGAMPTREALDRLDQEGLVKAIRRQGYQVTPITAKYVSDFFDLWAPISSVLVRLACLHASEQQLAAILEAIEGEREGQPSHDWNRRLQTSFVLIVEAADNEHLSMTWRRLSAVCDRIFALAIYRDPHLLRDVSSAPMLDALTLRDPDRAAAAAAVFVGRCRKVVMGVFDETGQVRDGVVTSAHPGAPAAGGCAG